MKLSEKQKLAARPLPIFILALRWAIRAGLKDMTRRVVKPQPVQCRHNDDAWIWRGHHTSYDALRNLMVEECPYGKVGDLVYLREPLEMREDRVALYKDDGLGVAAVLYNRSLATWRWRKSHLTQIHMPKRYARTHCRITSIDVERVQHISDDDALREGIQKISHGMNGDYYHPFNTEPSPDNYISATTAFYQLWCHINGEDSWDSNPFVWVIGFKLVQQKKTEGTK